MTLKLMFQCPASNASVMARLRLATAVHQAAALCRLRHLQMQPSACRRQMHQHKRNHKCDAQSTSHTCHVFSLVSTGLEGIGFRKDTYVRKTTQHLLGKIETEYHTDKLDLQYRASSMNVASLDCFADKSRQSTVASLLGPFCTGVLSIQRHSQTDTYVARHHS